MEFDFELRSRCFELVSLLNIEAIYSRKLGLSGKRPRGEEVKDDEDDEEDDDEAEEETGEEAEEAEEVEDESEMGKAGDDVDKVVKKMTKMKLAPANTKLSKIVSVAPYWYEDDDGEKIVTVEQRVPEDTGKVHAEVKPGGRVLNIKCFLSEDYLDNDEFCLDCPMEA